MATWLGDVFIVDGIKDEFKKHRWQRIATGLFQPLGVKIVNNSIYVTCRDQLAKLHDLNGDNEIDYVESYNNDHQVPEHFHEFAMGLQTDKNYYRNQQDMQKLPSPPSWNFDKSQLRW